MVLVIDRTPDSVPAATAPAVVAKAKPALKRPAPRAAAAPAAAAPAAPQKKIAAATSGNDEWEEF